MNLASKTIIPNSKTQFSFHSLAKNLYKIINEAYLFGDQQDFLADMTLRPLPHRGLPINNISMISQGSGTNAYRIIGGCFNPIFDINNINTENTLFHSYSHSKKSSKGEFEQEIIDFIYMDFIRSISILSLKKPGAMEPQLRVLSKEYKSDIWNALLDSNKSYLRQIDFANLLDTERDTISKQCKSTVNKKNGSN
ncbi:hypothetical protein [Psychrobacter sp. DAB_AL43B]|uniref:hypothetical protein n=1 Tax=Psychrobacter sp. DAB_AL43B TaxID=1028416 RepID=UPI0009A70542|nr:hypothetical protein [Psychrobacter sp. DAB_AL43B]SLJ85218.1 hypothetical protein DABAL43B_2029 [Psychrobacter sp. DAB_AL43B]